MPKRKRKEAEKGNAEKRARDDDDPGPRRQVEFSNRDVQRIVSAFRNLPGQRVSVPQNEIFRLDYVRSERRFDHLEKFYRLRVQRPRNRSLPALLNDLRSVLAYLINVAKLQASSMEDFTRIYFSRAPLTNGLRTSFA